MVSALASARVRRASLFTVAAIVWAAIGVAFLGRHPEPRANAKSAVIAAQAPGAAARIADSVPTVILHDPRASPGLNLVTAGNAARVLLMDLDGQVVHRWHRDLAELVDGATDRKTGTWDRARLLPGGKLLVLVGGVGLVALDRDSNVLWKAVEGGHSDIEVLPDGRIAVLSRGPRRRQDLSRGRVIVEDSVVLVTGDGRSSSGISLIDAYLASPFDEWRTDSMSGDVLQTSAIAQLPEGDLLVAMRKPGTLAVFRPTTKVFTASRTGEWRAVSDVDVLADGGLLVVDTAAGTPRTRVLELDPTTWEVRWTWEGTGDRPLRSTSGGVAQRLPNGNTLVTASDDGSTTEITPDGAVVWVLGPSAAGTAPITPYETERVPAELWP